MEDENRVESRNNSSEIINKYVSKTLPTAKIINDRFDAVEEKEKNKNEQNQNKESIDYES